MIYVSWLSAHLCYLLMVILFGNFSQLQPDQIEVAKLKEGVYIYQSFITYQGNDISANGLIVESSDEVVLIDTPWDNQQTRQLLSWIEKKLNKPVIFAVITHAHLDRIGGIEVLHDRNIKTIGNNLTAGEAVKNGYTVPDISFDSDTLLFYGNTSLEVFYPGPGHTPDNVVVYLNKQALLYGGCFIKSASSTSLGNLEDTVLDEWPESLGNVIDRYPDRALVIPGHGYLKKGAINNTLDLLSKSD